MPEQVHSSSLFAFTAPLSLLATNERAAKGGTGRPGLARVTILSDVL